MDDHLEEGLDAIQSVAFMVWCFITMMFVLISIAALLVPPYLFHLTGWRF